MTESQSNRDLPQAGDDSRGEETQLYVSAGDVVRVLDEYLAALKAGTAPSREQLLAQHPELAVQLEACLAGLNFLHAAQSASRPQQLGDFRIVREVGRGGMGAVFEAIQVSLGRRVALKILRFSTVSDKEALERFQREAATVATLHHTNIVPIFFVGSEHGVNYYAMQFIEGRNLAEVMAVKDVEIPVSQVAAWGLQAAEALAHAHRRGVVHRDVKPSNLILDKEQRLWLTDFGLARRLDDVTLSITGMLLGTPRYMSPEHARASTKRIDHRSDLFSLGATLYELLTRQPAFPGEAAHDVIQQILVDEPTPIRQLDPSVPRDMETIVMKCMAKEPGARYATADELAADLRALLEDRPIEARRANAIEQATRWLKHNQRSLSQVSTAALITLVATLTSLLGWSSYNSWNTSAIRLNALHPPLVAEILNATGATVRTETLPMQNPVSVGAGDYKVRVSAEGTLSQTFEIELVRGERDAKYTVNVADQWLIAPQPIEHSYDVFDLGTERALAVWGKEGISVHKRSGPQVGWSLKLSPETSPPLNATPGYLNPMANIHIPESAYGEDNQFRPWMIDDFIDVNQDGIGDIVCAARHQAWLMAISGNGEGVLWFTGRGHELGQPVQPQYSNNATQSTVLHSPLRVDDIDGDGERDLVVTIASLGNTVRMQGNTYVCERSLEAISSRTGKSLWRFVIPDELFVLPANVEVPYDLRWFGNLFSGRSSQGGNTMGMGTHRVRSPPQIEQTGAHVYAPTAPHLVRTEGHRQPLIAFVAGDKLVLLDGTSGTPRDVPTELGFRPGREVNWADIDGDGLTDLVTLEEVATTPNNPPVPKLVVWSLAKGQSIWSKQLDAYWPRKPGWSVTAPQWPLVTDLSGDGKNEIIVSDGRSHSASIFNGASFSNEIPSGTIVAYDGATGTANWTQTIVNLDATIDQFIDGPDLDGDGAREVFVATSDAREQMLHVDAISGATGRILWGGARQMSVESTFDGFRVLSLKWWQSGLDGWPQLMVAVSNGQYWSGGETTFTVVAFSAGTGEVTKVGNKLAEIQAVDMDHDGVEDLVVCSNKSIGRGARGSLHCLRGIARQPWKRLAATGKVMVDLDGDQVRDLVDAWGDGTLLATSGRTGRKLWQARSIRTTSQLRFAATDGACSGDLNGDGYQDLIVFESHTSGLQKTPLHVVSGRNGKLLWSLQDVKVKSIAGTLAAQFVDLEQDGAPEVMWLAAVDYGYPPSPLIFSNTDVQLWLFVASGRSGELRWAQPLSPAYGNPSGRTPAPVTFHDAAIQLASADLNGDGVRDVIVPAIRENNEFETRALDGRDGKILWSRQRLHDGLGQQNLGNWTAPAFCDFEGDGHLEVVLVEPFKNATAANSLRVEVAVTALSAAGGELWTKSTGSAFSDFHSFRLRGSEVLRPVVIHAPNSISADKQKTARVAVMLLNQPKIVSFNATGEFSERTFDYGTDLGGIFAHDQDHDGQEELIFIDRGTLFAVKADRLDQVIWQRALGGLGQQQIMQVSPKSDTFPPLVIVRTDGTQNSVIGFNAETGDPVWTCQGPIARSEDLTSFVVPNELAVLGGPESAPPLVYFQYEFISDCRQACLSPRASVTAISAKPVASSRAAWGARDSLGVQRLPAQLDGLRNDARWKRPLPWRSNLGSEARLVTFVMWSLFFATTLLVLPVSYVGWMIIQRRYQLSYLLLLPVVAAIFLQAALITAPSDNQFNSLLSRMSIAFAFSPPIVGIILSIRWALLRRWRLIISWLVVLLIGSLVIAAISVSSSLNSSPLVANESFDWSGWYHIFLPGAYLASWIIMLSLPIGAFVRWLTSRRRSPSKPISHSTSRAKTDRNSLTTAIQPSTKP